LTRFLLDTNVCIRLLSPKRSELLVAKLNLLHSEQVFLCSIAKAELYYGACRSSRQEENLALLDQFFSAFVTLPFDERCERIYGQIRADLTRKGTLIGPNDLLIGAIALAHQMTLVTHNVREFRRLPDLRIEDWEE
jgi:tRNA(fMet)-specific endonuclease VapC